MSLVFAPGSTGASVTSLVSAAESAGLLVDGTAGVATKDCDSGLRPTMDGTIAATDLEGVEVEPPRPTTAGTVVAIGRFEGVEVEPPPTHHGRHRGGNQRIEGCGEIFGFHIVQKIVR